MIEKHDITQFNRDPEEIRRASLPGRPAVIRRTNRDWFLAMSAGERL